MPRAAVDERGFEVVRRIRRAHEMAIPLSAFKALVREELRHPADRCRSGARRDSSMLPRDAASRRQAFDLIKEVIGARGPLSDEDRKRLQNVARLFDIDATPAASRRFTVVAAERAPSKSRSSRRAPAGRA